MDIHLQRLQLILSNSSWSEDSILRAMSSFRHIIEEKGIQKEYEYLNLYCNWTLHPEIDKSSKGFDILQSLSNAFTEHNSNPNGPKWIGDQVIESLSLHKLKEDIERFCDELKINKELISSKEGWEQFVTFLIINELQNKPIKIPEELGKKMGIKITESLKDENDNTVLEISYILFDFVDKNNQSTRKICWNIVTPTTKRKNITLLGPIAIIDQKMIDNYEPPKE